MTNESSSGADILELGRVGVPADQPGNDGLRFGGVVLVRAVDLGEADAGEHDPVGWWWRIGVDQALERHRLVLDGDRGATRHYPAGQRVTHELTERLEHPSEQRGEEAPRAPQREHQRSEPPFDVPRTDRYHDEREAGQRHRHAQDPAHHPAQARRICDVHGEQVDRARPAAQPTHAHFTVSLYVSDLLSRREFLASTAVAVAATGAHDTPFPMRPPRPLPPRSRRAAKPQAAATSNWMLPVAKRFALVPQGRSTLDWVVDAMRN